MDRISIRRVCDGKTLVFECCLEYGLEWPDYSVIANWLERFHNRKILIEELEEQICGYDCVFCIDGIQYHFLRTDFDKL